MDRLTLVVALFLVFGLVSFSHVWVSGSVLELSVKPGENITLHCDCKTSPGVYIIWYRNCSHENQPSLVLRLQFSAWTYTNDPAGVLNPLPRFLFVKNQSSGSYDLLIMNFTGADEGFYYCGTEQPKVLDGDSSPKYSRSCSNATTRLLLCSDDSSPLPAVPAVPWMMVFTPALTLLSSFLCLVLVYHFCPNADEEPQVYQKRRDSRDDDDDQDEDVCITRVVFRPPGGLDKNGCPV